MEDDGRQTKETIIKINKVVGDHLGTIGGGGANGLPKIRQQRNLREKTNLKKQLFNSMVWLRIDLVKPSRPVLDRNEIRNIFFTKIVRNIAFQYKIYYKSRKI